MYLGLMKPTIVNANCIQIVFKLFSVWLIVTIFSLLLLIFILFLLSITYSKCTWPYSMNNWLYVCVFYSNIHTSDILSSKNICWYFELLIHSNTMPLNYMWYVKFVYYQNLYITIFINWPNTFLLWSKAQF